MPNLRILALSTNGHNLDRIARPLRRSGITALNISLDSLDSERFQRVTGSSRFDSVMKGIDIALEAGFESVKVNAVLLRDLTDVDVPRFFDWVKTRPISLRFIELMRTGRNLELFEQRFLSAGEIQLILRKRGWTPVERGALAGPAMEYRHPSSLGSIGLIAPYAKEFCDTCNRLRVSSRGGLRLCLFGDQDYSLRQYLAEEGAPDLVASAVRSLMERKPASHYLKEGKYGNTWNLASIGG